MSKSEMFKGLAIAFMFAAMTSKAAIAEPRFVPEDAEKYVIELAIQQCLTRHGSPNPVATVTVAVVLDENATAVASSIRLIRSAGGTEGSSDYLFQLARRALLRCKAPNGFRFHSGEPEDWRNLEVIFNLSSDDPVVIIKYEILN